MRVVLALASASAACGGNAIPGSLDGATAGATGTTVTRPPTDTAGDGTMTSDGRTDGDTSDATAPGDRAERR